jgi:Tol biopolymer transport system component
MKRPLVLVAFVLLAVGLAFRAVGADAPARWIVFSATSPDSSTNQLFRIQSSGEGLQQITTGYLPAIAPAFSPDGKRIAFARSGSGLFAVSPDGTGLRRLTSNGRDSFPVWSPDGRRIAFVRPFQKAWSVYVVPSNGGPQRRRPRAPPAGRPSWTQAGLLIPSGGDLVRIDPATGHVLKYYGAQIDVVWGQNTVAVSPDTSTLTFVGARRPDAGDKECGEGPCQRFALYIENIRTHASPRKLTNDAGPAAFSPDGKTLAFVAQNALVLWPLAGGTSTTVATGSAYPVVAAPPAWQPR